MSRKTTYPNTVTLRIGSRTVMRPPHGSVAEAWEALRAECPEIDGARITESGRYLNVQVERTMGTARERLALVVSVAEQFGAPFQSCPSAWADGSGTTVWAAFAYRGIQVCLEAADCSCHPDAVAS